MIISTKECQAFSDKSYEVEAAISSLVQGLKAMESQRQVDRPMLMAAFRQADQQLRGYLKLLLNARVDVYNTHHRPKAKLYLLSARGRRQPAIRKTE